MLRVLGKEDHLLVAPARSVETRVETVYRLHEPAPKVFSFLVRGSELDPTLLRIPKGRGSTCRSLVSDPGGPSQWCLYQPAPRMSFHEVV